MSNTPEVNGSSALAVVVPHNKAERFDHRIQLQPEDVQTLRETYGADLTDSEFRLFLAVAQERGLNPLNRQIHPVKRGGQGNSKMVIQTAIDGFRLIAQRTGAYAGQTAKQWCGLDGRWTDVWISDQAPLAARVGVHKRGFVEPLYAVAHYREYVQRTSGGEPNAMWKKMPANQLAKCAEALALRIAFPEELSGMYTDDEMAQDDSDGQYIDVAASDSRQSQPTAAVTVEGPPEELVPVVTALNSLGEQGQRQLKKWWKKSQLPGEGAKWPSGVFLALLNDAPDHIDDVLNAMERIALGEIPEPLQSTSDVSDDVPTPAAPPPAGAAGADEPLDVEVVEEKPAPRRVTGTRPGEKVSEDPFDVLTQVCRERGISPPQKLQRARDFYERPNMKRITELSPDEALELSDVLQDPAFYSQPSKTQAAVNAVAEAFDGSTVEDS